MQVQDYFQKAAIGGKDSMSGTFNDKHVVPTLISFACSDAKTNNIITPQLKTPGQPPGCLQTTDQRGGTAGAVQL